MDHLPVGPRVSQAPVSSASSKVLSVSAKLGHHCPRKPDTPSASITNASGSQQAKKNTRGPYRQLKTAKITRVTNRHITIGYDEQYRVAPTVEQHSALAHDIGHVIRTYCLMQRKSWNVKLDEVKNKVRAQLSTNYNFEDINDDMLAYVNRLFFEQYKQWKSDLHQYLQTFDDSQVAL